MAQQRRRPPTDHTGAKREQLEREHEQELARRQGEMAMATRAAAEAKSEGIVDLAELMSADEPVEGEEPQQIWETVGAPELRGGSEGTVIIQVNTDLQDVTIGAGNHYSFEMGQRYRVPADVANHLEEKGYVWH